MTNRRRRRLLPADEAPAGKRFSEKKVAVCDPGWRRRLVCRLAGSVGTCLAPPAPLDAAEAQPVAARRICPAVCAVRPRSIAPPVAGGGGSGGGVAIAGVGGGVWGAGWGHLRRITESCM